MSHDFWERKLLQYFYAELSGSEREEFEQHLLECKVCQKELEELKALSEKISELIAPELSQETLDRIEAKAEAEAGKSAGEESAAWWISPRLVWSFAGAVLIVLTVVLGVWLFWDKPGGSDYDLAKFNQSLTTMEQELSEEDGLNLLTLAPGAEESLEEIETELSFFLPEPASTAVSFSAIEQELMELEGLGEGIWEI